MGIIGENKDNRKFINKIKNIKNDIIFSGHKKVPVKISNKVMKSICKITIEIKKGIPYGTGFFLNYSNSLKYLITNYHIINPSLENENITVEIHNKEKMKLNFKNRKTKYLK